MSTSKKLKFVVKRGDTGRIVRLETGEEDQVFDLLELSRSALKFHEEALLYLRKADDDKEISEVANLRDLESVSLLIVNDKKIEKETKEKLKEKEAGINKENMANAEKMQEKIANDNNNRNVPKDNYASFRDQFAQQGPTSSSNQHDLMNDLKNEVKCHDTAQRSFTEISEIEEIGILNRKLNSEGLDGFVYEIIPESYTDHNESKYYESHFSSEEECKKRHSKVSSTSDWSSWEARAGFSGWGVSVSASAGQSTSSGHNEGNKGQTMEKTRVAVVRRISFHQMKKFRVKVKLSDQAIEDAKEILKAGMHERQHAVKEFDKKYCTLVYIGPFSAGGRFATIATAKSAEAMEFSALEKEASARTKEHWSVGGSGYGVTAGAGKNSGRNTQSNEHESRQSSQSSVSVTINKESAPGNTCSENDLENKIKEAKNLCVFPTTDAKKSDFTHVYEIMKSQAKKMEDEELERVSDIIRLYSKGKMSDIERKIQNEYSDLKMYLKEMPGNMKRLSVLMRSLYADKPVGLNTDTGIKFRKLEGDIRQDAIVYLKCIFPASIKCVSSIIDHWLDYEALSYEEWCKRLPDILEETTTHKEFAKAVLEMHEEILFPLKKREDDAKIIMTEFKELERTLDPFRIWGLNVMVAMEPPAESKINGAAALVVAHTLIPALSNFIDVLKKAIGFFLVMEQELGSFEIKAGKAKKSPKQLYYKVMGKEAGNITSLCQACYAVLLDIRTDVEAIPSEGVNQSYVDKWLEKRR